MPVVLHSPFSDVAVSPDKFLTLNINMHTFKNISDSQLMARKSCLYVIEMLNETCR